MHITSTFSDAVHAAVFVITTVPVAGAAVTIRAELVWLLTKQCGAVVQALLKVIVQVVAVPPVPTLSTKTESLPVTVGEVPQAAVTVGAADWVPPWR